MEADADWGFDFDFDAHSERNDNDCERPGEQMNNLEENQDSVIYNLDNDESSAITDNISISLPREQQLQEEHISPAAGESSLTPQNLSDGNSSPSQLIDDAYSSQMIKSTEFCEMPLQTDLVTENLSTHCIDSLKILDAETNLPVENIEAIRLLEKTRVCDDEKDVEHLVEGQTYDCSNDSDFNTLSFVLTTDANISCKYDASETNESENISPPTIAYGSITLSIDETLQHGLQSASVSEGHVSEYEVEAVEDIATVEPSTFFPVQVVNESSCVVSDDTTVDRIDDTLEVSNEESPPSHLAHSDISSQPPLNSKTDSFDDFGFDDNFAFEDKSPESDADISSNTVHDVNNSISYDVPTSTISSIAPESSEYSGPLSASLTTILDAPQCNQIPFSILLTAALPESDISYLRANNLANSAQHAMQLLNSYVP